MRPVLLSTIPHTGTRFFIKLLEQQVFHVRHHIMRDHTEARPLECHTFATCHVGYEDLIKEYVSLFNPIVLTCERDREATRQSYARRNKLTGSFDNNYVRYDSLFSEVKPDLVLSIDADDRDDRLSDLSELMGVELKTNWEPVGQWNKPGGRDWPLE